MKQSFLLVLLSLMTIITSCAKQEDYNLKESITPIEEDAAIIPIETALESLNAFLLETQMASTKSGEDRKVLSVETHYSNRFLTRSEQPFPDAYLVNFEDNSGYAILGANTLIDPIVAVIEDGNKTWDTILNYKEPEPSSFEKECLDPGISPDMLLLMCVNGALNGKTVSHCPETKNGPYTTEVLPLTSNYLFNQHVTYCHKSNRRFVLCGCASTALSIIVAYNNYPRIRADYELLNVSNCNSADGSGLYYYIGNRNLYLKLSDYFTNYSSIPTPNTDSQKLAILKKVDSNITSHGNPTSYGLNYSFYRTRYKLTSSIFYTLSNIIQGWDATGTMPGAVKTGLQDLGYTNVTQTQKSSLTNAQIESLKDMLLANKPVIMCGWSLFGLDNSHYWVVDGIRQNSLHTYIHCNWGWSGNSNGWFSSTCIRSSAGDPFDDGTIGSGSGNEWNNIIVYTYQKQNTTPYISVHNLYDNRIAY